MSGHGKKIVIATAILLMVVAFFFYKSQDIPVSNPESKNERHTDAVPQSVQTQTGQTPSKADPAHEINHVEQPVENPGTNPEAETKIDPKLKEGFYVDRMPQNESGLRQLMVAIEQYGKIMGFHPKGDNVSVSNELTGKNSKRMPFIEWKLFQVGEKGEFLDVWKTPVAFELGTDGKIKITSAGADKKIGTSDDEVIQNFDTFNGVINGVIINGVIINGVIINGVIINGVIINGVIINGVSP
jgi:hypothetical protein